MLINALEILYEDAHILVCIKPHGIATQSRRIGQPDMVNLLKNHIHKTDRTKGEPYLAVHPPLRPARNRNPGLRQDALRGKGTEPPAYQPGLWQILPRPR